MKTILLSSVAICAMAPGSAFAQAAPANPAQPGIIGSRAISATLQNGDAPQSDTSGLGDIVVTAQRRSENLQNVPIAITAISSDKLASGPPLVVQDLNALAPGLNVTTSGGSQVLPRLRGIGITAAAAGLENPVAVYVDGVYFASPRGSLLTLSDVAQIAVLKGPQGTLFGRNATGGVIQITTREPTQDFTLKAEVGYGNKDSIVANAYVAGGLAKDVEAALSINFNDQRDGFGVNVFNRQQVNRSRNFAARSKVRFDLGPDTTVKLAGDYSNSVASLPAFRLLDGAVGTGGTRFTGSAFDVNSSTQPFYQTRQGGGSLTIEQGLPFAKLTSITAYRDAWSINTLDGDFTSAPTTSITNVVKDRQFTQELQLSSIARGPLVWTAGIFYFWSAGVYDPLKVTVGGGSIDLLTLARQSTRSIAAYGQGTYEVADGLKLTAGLRYTFDRQSLGATTFTQTAASSTQTGTGFDSSNNRKLTWRFAADYRLSQQVLAYASVSRGAKSAGYNSQALPTKPFQPETLDDYEIGLKTNLFDHKLRFNVAGFYYNYRDLQVSSYPFGTLTIANAANAKIYGLDVDAEAAVTRHFTLSAGLSLLHARYQDFLTAQITQSLPGGGNLISSGNASGKHVTVSPDVTLNLGALYTIPIGSNALRLQADYYYNSGWYPTPDNRIKQPGYGLVNGSVAFRFSDDRYELRVWSRNLFDKVYATQINVGAAGDAIVVAPGRTYGLSLSLNL